MAPTLLRPVFPFPLPSGLGARQGEVISLFVSRGLVLVLVGVTIGLVASLAFNRFLSKISRECSMLLPIFVVTPCTGELSVEGGRASDGYGPANTASSMPLMDANCWPWWSVSLIDRTRACK